MGNRKRLIYNMAKNICDTYMTYTCSCAFIENNKVIVLASFTTTNYINMFHTDYGE